MKYFCLWTVSLADSKVSLHKLLSQNVSVTITTPYDIFAKTMYTLHKKNYTSRKHLSFHATHTFVSKMYFIFPQIMFALITKAVMCLGETWRTHVYTALGEYFTANLTCRKDARENLQASDRYKRILIGTHRTWICVTWWNDVHVNHVILLQLWACW